MRRESEIGHHLRASERRTIVTGWEEYERLKREWLREHPEATVPQYQAAMRELARKAGV